MDSQDEETKNAPSPRRRAIGALGLVAVLVGGAFLWNRQNIGAPTQEALQADPRNAGLDVDVRYAYWIQTRDKAVVGAEDMARDVLRQPIVLDV